MDLGVMIGESAMKSARISSLRVKGLREKMAHKGVTVTIAGMMIQNLAISLQVKVHEVKGLRENFREEIAAVTVHSNVVGSDGIAIMGNANALAMARKMFLHLLIQAIGPLIAALQTMAVSIMILVPKAVGMAAEAVVILEQARPIVALLMVEVVMIQVL